MDYKEIEATKRDLKQINEKLKVIGTKNVWDIKKDDLTFSAKTKMGKIYAKELQENAIQLHRLGIIDWIKELIKEAIKEIATGSAEKAYELYSELEDLVENFPWLLEHINDALRKVKDEISVNLNPRTMTWIDLFLIWFLEKGKPEKGNKTITFTSEAYTTKQIREIRKVREFEQECINERLNIWNRPKGTDRKFREEQFYGDFRREKNYSTYFLGSFSIDVNYNDYIWGVNIEFTIKNTSGWESATRFRSGNEGIITDKARGKGIHLGGNLHQVWKWDITCNNEDDWR